MPEFNESTASDESSLSKQEILADILFQKVTRQFETFREIYNQAEDEEKIEIKNRFNVVFGGQERLVDFAADADDFSRELFLDYIMTDPANADSIVRLQSEAGARRDGEAGIFTFDIEERDGVVVLIPHIAPYKGDSFFKDLRESVEELKRFVIGREDIQCVLYSTCLFNDPRFREITLPSSKALTEEPNLEDTRGQIMLSGSQTADLQFSARHLQSFLKTGEKPTSWFAAVNRQEFLEHVPAA